MNIEQYYQRSGKLRFTEYPTVVYPDESYLRDVVNLDEADLELKRYLAGLILCRCFPFTGGIIFDEPKWFIKHFISVYTEDAVRPWLTSTIKRAMEMVISENVFTDNLIGTTFLFGIMEFYAKQKLSGRKLPVGLFEEKDKDGTYLSLEYALINLQKKKLPLSKALKKIDNDMRGILKTWCVNPSRWKQFMLANRVSEARNDMLHGDKHNHYTMGEYMAMLYILFHLYDLTNTTTDRN